MKEMRTVANGKPGHRSPIPMWGGGGASDLRGSGWTYIGMDLLREVWTDRQNFSSVLQDIVRCPIRDDEKTR